MDIPDSVARIFGRLFLSLLPRRLRPKPKCEKRVFLDTAGRCRVVIVNRGVFPVILLRVVLSDGRDVLPRSVRLEPGDPFDVQFDAGFDDVADDDVRLVVADA